MNMLTESSASVVQSLGTIVPELPAYVEITVLLIAPVGIFLFFIFIGDATNHAEIWIGAALTLLLSGIGAFYQVYTVGIPISVPPSTCSRSSSGLPTSSSRPVLSQRFLFS